MHVDGPAVIYDKVANIRKMEKKIFPHECEYCIELMRDESNHEVMRTLLKTELPGILFRHLIRNASLKINN